MSRTNGDVAKKVKIPFLTYHLHKLKKEFYNLFGKISAILTTTNVSFIHTILTEIYSILSVVPLNKELIDALSFEGLSKKEQYFFNPRDSLKLYYF